MLTVMSDADAALAVARAFFRAWTVNRRVVLTYRLRWGGSFIAVQHRHTFRKIYGKFYESGNGSVFIIPRGLMNQFVLSMTDGMVSIGGTGLNHVTDHPPGFFTVAVVQILASYVAITFDCPLVLI